MLEGGAVMDRPWWYVAGNIRFRSGSDAVRAKQETPIFLAAVAQAARNRKAGL
jgi:hypothetical protein